MLTVTERAAELLRQIQTEQDEPDKVLRIVERSGEFELVLDSAQERDQVIQSEGSDVLLIGEDVAEALEDAIIDCQDTPEGPRFTLAASEEE